MSLESGRVRVTASIETDLAVWQPVRYLPEHTFFAEARARVTSASAGAGVVSIVTRAGAFVLGFDGSNAGGLQTGFARPLYQQASAVGAGWHVFRVERLPDGTGRILVDGEEVALVPRHVVVAWQGLEAPVGVEVPAVRWGQPCTQCAARIEWDYVRWGCVGEPACEPSPAEDDEVCNGLDDDCNGVADDASPNRNLYPAYSVPHVNAVDASALTLVGDGTSVQAWRNVNGGAGFGYFDPDGVAIGDVIPLGDAAELAIAWSGAPNGRLLGAIRDAESRTIVARRYGRDGGQIGPNVVVRDAVFGPALASTPTGWLLAGVVSDGGVRRLQHQQLSRGGVLGDAVVLPYDPQAQGGLSVAATGNRVALAFTTPGANTEAMVRVALRDGEARTLSDVGNESRHPQVVWDGDRWLVVWAGDRDGQRDLFFNWLSADGQRFGEPVNITQTPGVEANPRAAWTGHELAVSFRMALGYHLVHVDPDGGQSDPAAGLAHLVSFDGLTARAASACALAYDGTQYVVNFAGTLANRDGVYTTRGPIGGCRF